MPRARSLKSIRAEIERLQKLAEAMQKQTKPGVAAVVRLMRKHKLTIEDVQAALGAPAPAPAPRKTARGAAGRAVEAKYRDPATGATWSGRGRPPRWLAAAEAAGKSRSEFAV
jgi:DNA-binding protein H-NS